MGIRSSIPPERPVKVIFSSLDAVKAFLKKHFSKICIDGKTAAHLHAGVSLQDTAVPSAYKQLSF